MIGDDIADYLTSGGVSSSQVFVGEMPERPITALVITPTGGLGPSRTMSGALNGAPIEDEQFQIRTRSDVYSDAEVLIRQAHGLLSGFQERLINGRRYYYGVPLQTPFYLGRDDERRAVFACNYKILRAESTA